MILTQKLHNAFKGTVEKITGPEPFSASKKKEFSMSLSSSPSVIISLPNAPPGPGNQYGVWQQSGLWPHIDLLLLIYKSFKDLFFKLHGLLIEGPVSNYGYVMSMWTVEHLEENK
ncbi:hypothetical protein AAZX31_12G149400 [Glycine max]|uniref:uncharacterized protein LOC114379357 n=1 Tax=Glycine soja TaxID=3848 RepID=UPI00103F64FA|nr:uncharacterized protein LOC114379357 [Glycine soja]